LTAKLNCANPDIEGLSYVKLIDFEPLIACKLTEIIIDLVSEFSVRQKIEVSAIQVVICDTEPPTRAKEDIETDPYPEPKISVATKRELAMFCVEVPERDR
jgi:hypothetical protein